MWVSGHNFYFGVELRKLLPGAEYFGSCRRFAHGNCRNQSINTFMIQDVLKWSLLCNGWKQLQMTDLTAQSKNSAPHDSLRSSTPGSLDVSRSPYHASILTANPDFESCHNPFRLHQMD